MQPDAEPRAYIESRSPHAGIRRKKNAWEVLRRHAMRIAFITAGAAGMYCGSCMRDNALVTALRQLGHDALLIPAYMPIKVDEPDASEKRVFFGGINILLGLKVWLFRHTPRFLDRLHLAG